MRLIALLLSLLILGLLVYRQLQGGPGRDAPAERNGERAGAPRVPTTPSQLPAFEQQMNDYADEQAAQRAAAIEAAERGE